MKKFLTYLGLFLLAVILLYLLTCFLGPKNFNMAETHSIDAPAPIVFNIVNDLPDWNNWSDWNLSDSTMQVTFSGPDQGVGARSEWESSQGNGSQEIVESVAHERIRTKLEFEGWDGTNFSNWNFKSNNSTTDVSVDFEGTPIPFLLKGMIYLSGAKKGMRNSYKKSLKNLEKIALDRKEGIYKGMTIKPIYAVEKNFVMTRQEVDMSNIQQFYATNLGSLFGKVQAAGAEMDGMPCGLYFRMVPANNKIDMAAAIPTAEAINVKGAQTLSIPPQKALQIDFYGDYTGIGLAHDAMADYLRDRQYLQDIPIIEEYVTDPGTEPDPSKWLTQVTYYFTESE